MRIPRRLLLPLLLLVAGVVAAAACSGGGSGGGTFTFALSAPPYLDLPAGGAASVAVTVSRAGFPITVGVAGLPAGVTADPLTLAAGLTAGSLTFHAASPATAGLRAAAKVTASGGGDSHPGTVQLLVSGTPGSLDLTFGSGGKVLLATLGSNIVFNTVGVVGTSAIVAAGALGTNGVIVELDPSGQLAPGFNGGQPLVVASAYGLAQSTSTELWVNADGSMLLTAGSLAQGAAIWRIRADGSFDPSFGNGGRVDFSQGSAQVIPSSIALDAGGRILLGGSYASGTSAAGFAARFLANGSPDPSFAGGGLAVLPPLTPGGTIFGVAPDTAGRVLVGGESFTPGPIIRAAAGRYLADGAPDTSFGPSPGSVVQEPVGGFWDVIVGGPASSLFLGGEAPGQNAAVELLDSAGNRVASFGSSGVARFSAASFTISLVLDGLGRPTAGVFVNSYGMRVARLTTAGALDASFGTGGIADVPPSATAHDLLYAHTLTPDGRIVGVGVSGFGIHGGGPTVFRMWN